MKSPVSANGKQPETKRKLSWFIMFILPVVPEMATGLRMLMTGFFIAHKLTSSLKCFTLV